MFRNHCMQLIYRSPNSLHHAAHVQVTLKIRFSGKITHNFVIPIAGRCTVGIESQQNEFYISRRITSQTASLQN